MPGTGSGADGEEDFGDEVGADDDADAAPSTSYGDGQERRQRSITMATAFPILSPPTAKKPPNVTRVPQFRTSPGELLSENAHSKPHPVIRRNPPPGTRGIARPASPSGMASGGGFLIVHGVRRVHRRLKRRARAKSVITHLLAKKGGTEPKALYRKDTGWIGIDYGEPGNPNNAYKGGHGLAHILAKHPGAEKNLLEVLQKGECYKHDTSRYRLFLIHGDAVAVLTKHRTGHLLITDYANLSPKEIERMKVNGKYHVKGEN